MTSLSRQKILEKLQHLQEYIEYLHTLQKECSAEQSFVSDFHLFGNTERYLQLSIQAIIDASHLLILNLGFKRPTDNYEAVSTLFEKNILADDLAHAITRMIGLRNLLVHEYGQIYRKKSFTSFSTISRILKRSEIKYPLSLRRIRATTPRLDKKYLSW